MKHEKNYLPELDSSLPDNDLGNMVAGILIWLVGLALFLRWWYA